MRIEVSGQAKRRVVRALNHLFFAGKAEASGNRTKRLFARQFHVVTTLTQYRRLPEVAAERVRFPARQHFGSFRDSIFNMLTHFIDRRRFDQRPDDDAVIQTIPHLQCLNRIGQFVGEFVVDTLLDIKAVHTDTNLPGITELIRNSAFYRRIDVRIVEHDIGSIATEFHRHFFHGFRCVTYQRFTDSR